MKLDGKNSTALILIGLGALLLLKTLGFGIGSLFSILFPLVLIGLGILGIKNGKSLVGLVLLLIGAISLLAKLASWLAPVLAIGLIVYGCMIVFGRRAHR